MRRLTRKPWFGPKRYVGWGWSISSWQGVVVTVLAVALIVLTLTVLGRGAAGWVAVVFVAVLYLVVVALTGDPPGGPERRRDSGRDT